MTSGLVAETVGLYADGSIDYTRRYAHSPLTPNIEDTLRTLTIALERLDRHVPFFMATVPPPDGFVFRALEVGMGDDSGRRDGTNRHGRMFHDREFDICEQSLASFIISRSRSDDFIATPVFPRRLFSQNCIFVNVDAGIEKPMDLVGKKVGVWSFQVTLCVLAKGDLKAEYGVPWEKVDWHVQYYEELPWQGHGLSIQNIPADADAGEMLVDGALDALFHPHPPCLSVIKTNGTVERVS